MSAPQYRGTWPKLRLRILDRDGWCCQIRGPHCRHTHDGDRCATDVDAIIPHQLDGTHSDPANLRAACATCNRGRVHQLVDGLTTALTTLRDHPQTDPPTPSRQWR